MDELFFAIVLILIFIVILLTIYQPSIIQGAAELIRGLPIDDQSTDNDDFPYKHLSMNLMDVKARFKRLGDYKFTFKHMPYQIRNMPTIYDLQYDGKPTIIVNERDDYLKYNLISDYFMDYCRMRARRYDQALSPWQYWQTRRDDVHKYAIDKYGKDDNYSLREAVYHLVAETTSFRPTLMAGFIDMFNAKSVLDISAGWGDRLIGAMAMGVKYCGVDPNSCLHPNYKRMIDTLITSPNDRDKYKMIQSPFETAELPDCKPDLILTSPPYFDLEHYSDEQTQSIHGRSIDTWFDEFLMTSIAKAWKILTPNGHMVIIINDIRDGPSFVQRMIDAVNDRLTDAKYLGVISYSEFHGDEPKSPQPCWIWLKTMGNIGVGQKL